MNSSPSPMDKAISFASAINFHQSITLPTTSSRSRLRVSFATTHNFYIDETAPTVLFCGGMGASRYSIWRIDALAKREGVRVIFIDRPGVGGSTPVPLEDRVQTWLEIVTAVLAHLRVDAVALISHSVGAVYAINTLIHLPRLLDQKEPFVAMLTPWVHPVHSSAPLMQLVDRLPSALIGPLHHIHKFVGGYIESGLQFSSGMLGITNDLPEDKCQEYYAMDTKTWTQVCRLQTAWMREEQMSGISADANLCMQKDARDWGAYTPLPTAITSLQQIYPKKTRQLAIRAYFSETDMLIGKAGQAYFEQCWADAEVVEVDFKSEAIKATDHDSICLVEKRCLERIFRELKRRGRDVVGM